VTARTRLAVVIGLGGLYLGALGFLSGMLVERMRFDVQRAATLRRLAATEDRLHARLMRLERRAERPEQTASR
jgi:hypothetical protein